MVLALYCLVFYCMCCLFGFHLGTHIKSDELCVALLSFTSGKRVSISAGACFNMAVQPTQSLNLNSELTYSEMGNSELSKLTQFSCSENSKQVDSELSACTTTMKSHDQRSAKKTSAHVLPSMRNFNS